MIQPISSALNWLIERVDKVMVESGISENPRPALYLCMGAFLGAVASVLLVTTGPFVALHEIVGHGLLGLYLTTNFATWNRPQFQIDGWDNFLAIGKATTLREKLQEVGRFLIGYDRNGDGLRGRTSWWPGTPNALGKLMSEEGRSAWISISGSIPELLLNNTLVVRGISLSYRNPALGGFVTLLGLDSHIIHSFYPIQAAWMSSDQLVSMAGGNHDFANFAVSLGEITSLSPKIVALATAIIFVASVPAAACIAFRYSKSQIARKASWVQ